MKKLWAGAAMGAGALAVYYGTSVAMGPVSAFTHVCCGGMIGIVALVWWAVVNPDV